MKVGIFSESDADEAGIRILAEAVLGFPFEIILPVRLRGRGWSAVISNLPSVYKSLHWRSDAQGLIVVVDSDESASHDRSHEEAGYVHTDCRYCLLHRTVRALQQHLPVRANGPLRIALGVALPAIEAWYQCGIDRHSTEARFTREDPNALYELRRDLKRKTYGSVSAPQVILRKKAVEESTRLAKDLDVLERLFPIGFGMLARSLRSWK